MKGRLEIEFGHKNQTTMKINPLQNREQSKILFLASNPSSTAQLRLGEEFREITEALERSKQREHFTLTSKWAVRVKDFRRAILENTPNILHFSGHGSSTVEKEQGRGLVLEHKEEDFGVILLEKEQGASKYVKGEAIANLIKLFANEIDCVVLNSCYSQKQAEAIIQYIPYVIGMGKSIADPSAIAFSTAFYEGIGAGKDIEFAFDYAKSSIDLEGLKGADTPQLMCNQKLINIKNEQ